MYAECRVMETSAMTSALVELPQKCSEASEGIPRRPYRESDMSWVRTVTSRTRQSEGG